jgi:hypothetical protein
MGLFVLAAYTALIVCANKVMKSQSNLLPPGFDLSVLTKHDLDRRRYGSKLVVVVEQAQITVIWACKASLLIMYHRLTRTALRNENIAIRLLSVYVVLGFVVMEILYFAAWCRPIQEYWTIPTSNSQCNALINHRITKAIFNLSSDLIMLVIALQMLIRSQLPLKRKLILCGIFSLGIFVIIASILNSYYSFKNPYRQTWIYWYVRESSTAILVANMPYTWTILREFFDLGSFDESIPPWTFHSARTAQGRRTTHTNNQSVRPAATTKARHSPEVSRGSQGTQAMTLVDSMSPLKRTHHTREDSPRGSKTESNLNEASMQPQDSAVLPLPSAELGLADSASLRPVSPAHSRQLPSRITEDGTGGFYLNDHSISPPSRAYLAARANRSREPSLSSLDRRPMSPTLSLASTDTSEMRYKRRGSGAGLTAGTGRSAHDRRVRARLSA